MTTAAIVGVVGVILVVVVGLSLLVGRLSNRHRCQHHGHDRHGDLPTHIPWVVVALFLIINLMQLLRKP